MAYETSMDLEGNKWTDGIGVTHYDDGTPRPKCDLCGGMDGWHSGSCDNMPGKDMVCEHGTPLSKLYPGHVCWEE
jgi:hypothetical protein